MPSLKSLFVLGAAALTVFAFPTPSTGDNGLVARNDAMANIAMRGLEVPRAPVVAEEIVKREPEPLAARGGATLVDIFADVKVKVQAIADQLDTLTAKGTVKVDVNVLVDIVVKIKAIIDACIVDIKAIANLDISVILTVQVAVFAKIILDVFVLIIACLQVSVKACVDVDVHLVVDVIAQVDASLSALLQLCFSLVLGLGVALGVLLDATVVLAIKALALVDVIAVIKAYLSLNLLALLGL